MKAKKLVISILLTPLALVFALLVIVLCGVSGLLAALFKWPYLVFNGIKSGCQTTMRSFISGYEQTTKVVASVRHEPKA